MEPRGVEPRTSRVRRFGVIPQSAQCRDDREAQAAGGGSSSRSIDYNRPDLGMVLLHFSVRPTPPDGVHPEAAGRMRADVTGTKASLSEGAGRNDGVH